MTTPRVALASKDAKPSRRSIASPVLSTWQPLLLHGFVPLSLGSTCH